MLRLDQVVDQKQFPVGLFHQVLREVELNEGEVDFQDQFLLAGFAGGAHRFLEGFFALGDLPGLHVLQAAVQQHLALQSAAAAHNLISGRLVQLFLSGLGIDGGLKHQRVPQELPEALQTGVRGLFDLRGQGVQFLPGFAEFTPDEPGFHAVQGQCHGWHLGFELQGRQALQIGLGVVDRLGAILIVDVFAGSLVHAHTSGAFNSDYGERYLR